MLETLSELGQSESEPNPPDSERDYTFSISISPGGFSIDGEEVSTLSDLLKHVIAIVQEHPNTNNANEQLQAGYESGNPSIPLAAPSRDR